MRTELLAAFVLALVALSALRSRELRGEGWAFFRVLVPSWRFFEDVGHSLLLEYRSGEPNHMGEWQNALERPAPRWYSFLFNPSGNLFLAEQSLLQRFEGDIGNLDPARTHEFEHATSFLLVKQLVRVRLQQEGRAAGTRYQFRVSRITEGTTEVFVHTELYEV